LKLLNHIKKNKQLFIVRNRSVLIKKSLAQGKKYSFNLFWNREWLRFEAVNVMLCNDSLESEYPEIRSYINDNHFEVNHQISLNDIPKLKNNEPSSLPLSNSSGE